MELFCLPTLSLCKALRTLFCWFHNDVISVLAPLTQPIFQRFHSELLNFNNFYQMILSPLVFFSLQRKKSYGNGAKMQTPSFPLCLIGFKSLQAWYSSWWFRFLYLIYNVHSVHCVQTEKSLHYFFLKKTSSTNFCNAGKNVTKLDDASKGNKSAANLQANWWFFGAAQQWRQVQI